MNYLINLQTNKNKMEKREQIKKWFLANDKNAQFKGLLLIVGLVFVLIGFWMLSEGELIAIGAIGLGGYFLWGWFNTSKSSLTESELDRWLEEDIQEVIKSRPFDKLGITKNDLVAESLLVVGPIYWSTSGFDVKDILMKKGKDGFNRYSVWTIQVFCFTENYLCSYKCHYNWIKNTCINESTNEFFYKDVVSVKTDTISSAYTLMNGQRLVHSEAFQLKLAGDEITVITNDASLNTSSVMVSKAEKAVQSIRAMLRDKKK
jgi:hypothetical protein